MNEDKLSSDPIRDLGFVAWKNNLAWMESMEGPRWRHVLEEETHRFRKALAPLDTEVKTLEDELEATQLTEEDGTWQAAEGEVLILPLNTLSYRWKHAGPRHRWHVATDLDARPGHHVWTIRDGAKGSENYELEYNHKSEHVWKKSKVGPYVAVVGNRCYYLEADVLWYHRLCSVDKTTGKDRRVHFEQTDPQWNLEILRVSGGQAVLRANRAGQQSLWDIPESGTCTQLWEDGVSFVPVTATSSFVRARGQRHFVLRGPLAKSFRMPNLKKHIPQAFDLSTATLITRRYGVRSLWACSGSGAAKRIQTLLGDVQPDPWTGRSFLFTCPGAHPFFGSADAKVRSEEVYGGTHYRTAKSQDSIRVPYVLVLPKEKEVKGLFVSVYGAYGLPSSMNTQRWKPLIDRGWALALPLVRGGGDHDDAWAEAARRTGKAKSIFDLEACLRAAQKDTQQTAKTTVLFGRSAGGYTVGATLNRHAKGDAFRTVYTEVPYVDVLRTTTNPDLPLTKLEYEEFGWPAERLANFGAVLNLSPVDGVPSGGIPDIFVLCRTGTADRQVYAYESAKWIQRLRSPNESAPKLLAVSRQEGHFPPPSAAFRQRAEDLALLLSRVTSELSSSSRKKSQPLIYKMAKGYTRKNRKTERKSRKAERKSRKNERKSRKNERKSRRTNRK